MEKNQSVQPNAQQAPTEIEVPAEVGFQVRLQEFDKNISAHKAEAARLEAEKANFVYNSSIEAVTKQYAKKDPADAQESPVPSQKKE